jgi:hypothetical protein
MYEELLNFMEWLYKEKRQHKVRHFPYQSNSNTMENSPMIRFIFEKFWDKAGDYLSVRSLRDGIVQFIGKLAENREHQSDLRKQLHLYMMDLDEAIGIRPYHIIMKCFACNMSVTTLSQQETFIMKQRTHNYGVYLRFEESAHKLISNCEGYFQREANFNFEFLEGHDNCGLFTRYIEALPIHTAEQVAIACNERITSEMHQIKEGTLIPKRYGRGIRREVIDRIAPLPRR